MRKIKRWIWFRDKQNKMLGYLYNPYLKNSQDCLETFNIIHNGNLTLKDVKVRFED